ncbi:MAG: YitT family protein [Anaerolineae bacterium]|uniref:YitT family protein n=1 Tax=Promineifilum sp. TaxID=2664178 RepID=UPI001DA1D534|nr:YitT family protein [Anaerolineales bacterium]MCO5180774.1 YitT family protein [Promineifilum sp.]MCW5845972.1 YitT family protein [Anaerolineae bacterium]
MAAFKAYLMRVSPINWRETMRNYVFLTVGALMMIVNFNLLMTPGNIAPGGMGGLSLILNYYTGIPRGVGMLLMSTPLIALGFWQLGRFRFLVRTLYVTIIYTIGVDLTARFFPAQGIVDDLLLTALFGGVLGGIGYGLVVHGRGMVSGTGIISRVIQLRTGIPLSQLYVFIDGFVIIALGLTFGWERALYGLIMLFVWGLASDYVLEGPSVVRVVFIVTDLPEAVGAVLMERLRVGVTRWVGEGMYTHETRAILFCTVARPDVEVLSSAVSEIDPDAFVVIGQGHQTRGGMVRPPVFGKPQPAEVDGA